MVDVVIPRGVKSAAGAIGSILLRAAEDKGCSVEEGWPSSQYRDDPVAFCREVVGIEPWQKQIEVIEAIRDNKRVAVKAGRKVSKSCTATLIALWWFTTWEDAIVVAISTTGDQLKKVIWRELTRMHTRSQRPIRPDDPALRMNSSLTTKPIDGTVSLLPANGLHCGDRLVAGSAARDGVAAQGVSGPHMLYIIDEASGIRKEIIDAVTGNLAGGGRVVLFGNPTRCEEEFFDAFNNKAKSESNPGGYCGITISSEESPNVTSGKDLIPGMATREWVEARKFEWGEESSIYRVHVKGEFAPEEAGKIIPLSLIEAAEQRWEETEAVGVLHIGIDPAMSESGDEACFAFRRGLKMIALHTFRGLSPEAHLVQLLGFIKSYSSPRDPMPIVTVDELGDVGTRVVNAVFRPYAQTHPKDFVLVGVRASDNAVRDPRQYDKRRDELWGSLADWLRAGGALVEDLKLEKELHSPSWTTNVRDQKKATDKKELRRMLGRSPDRADALALACWENTNLVIAPATPHQSQAPRLDPYAASPDRVFDPYKGFGV